MTKLNELDDRYWNDLQDIVLFGFGRQGKKMYSTLNSDFNIVAIVDNSPEKQGKKIDDHIILSFDQAKSFLHGYKIIVTTSQYYYQSIREQLAAEGLADNTDYVMYEQFVRESYISLTTKCTLNCENCMQFCLTGSLKGKKRTQ